MTATTSSSLAEPTSRAAALAAPIACAGCLAAGAAYVAANDPDDGGVFIPCPFRALTGLWCPGCGLTRATHHVFRGDITQALRYNAFVLVVIAGVVAAWVSWTLRASGVELERRTIPAPASFAAIAVLVGYAVLRNVTGLPLRG